MKMIPGLATLSLLPLTVLAGTPPAANGAPSATDLAIEAVRLDPPPGSTLKVSEPVVVTMKYGFTRPAYPMRVWAKILDRPDSDSIYQGSTEEMTPGHAGTVERFVTMKVPGTIDTISLVAKDAGSREIFRKDIPAHYTFVSDATTDAARTDGAGSRITAVHVTPSSPAVLGAGHPVAVRIDYDVRGPQGLMPWAEPVTTCRNTYDGMTAPVTGAGSMVKSFVVAEKCAVRKIRVGLSNAAYASVAEQVVDVQIDFVERH
jgi:hypothetical protein